MIFPSPPVAVLGRGGCLCNPVNNLIRGNPVFIKTNLKLLQTLLLLGMTALLAVPACAANSAMMELIEILHRKGSITLDEYNLLKQAASADQEKAQTIQADIKEEVKLVTRDLPKITTTDKIEIASQDGDFKWTLGGRVQLDAIAFNSDNRDFGSGTQMRRARMEIGGTFYQNWEGKVQYDFTGSGRAGIRDMYIRWKGWDGTTVTAGNFRTPFSMEHLSSSNSITFMERSLADAPVAALQSRQTGIGVSTQFNSLYTLHGMIFSTGGPAAPGGSIDEGYGIGGRATFVPVNDGTRLIHIGAAGSHLTASQNRRTQSISARPETGFGLNVVSTGALGTATNPVKDFTIFGLEGAVMYGPASLQGEYIHTGVSRKGLSNADFTGFYLQGSYLLTGESRRYNFVNGIFNSPRPHGIVGKGGIGAWELALRFSSLDLNDGPVNGGKVEDLTVGLNWYPVNNIRLMANYVTVLDNSGGPYANDEPDAFLFRVQTNW